MRSRRDLLRQALNFSAVSAVYVLAPRSPVSQGNRSFAAIKTVSDIDCVAVGKVTPLLARDLIAGLDVQGGIDEGDHSHIFTVTAAQIAELHAGKVVKVKSTIGTDGSGYHTVTIDPARLVANGSTIQFFQSENGDLIALRLGKGSEPYLYVEGMEGLDPATVKYCIGSTEACQNERAFKAMEKVEGLKDRTIYSSIERLTVSESQKVFVWATTKSKKKVRLAVKIGG